MHNSNTRNENTPAEPIKQRLYVDKMFNSQNYVLTYSVPEM